MPMKTFDSEIERNMVMLLMAADMPSLKDWMPKVKVEWFQSPANEQAIVYIKESVEQDSKPDFNVLSNRTKGGISEVDARFGTLVVSVQSFTTICDELRRLYMVKILSSGLESAAIAGNENPVSALAVLKDTENQLLGQAPSHICTPQETIAKANKESVDALNPSNSMFIPAHIDFMDELASITRTQVWVESAFQGFGKTALALQQCNAQSLNGMRSAYFCVESSACEITKRLAAHNSKMPVFDFMGKPSPGVDEGTIVKAYGRIFQRKYPAEIFGSEDFKRDMDTLEMIARSVKDRLGGLDMIYVDFLQKFKVPAFIKGSASERERKGIEYNMARCKELAESLDVGVKVLVQLNRATYGQTKPGMNSLRGSSSIEDDAHVISFLHRTSEKDRGDGYAEYEYYLGKGRLFWSPPVQLCYHGRSCTFMRFFPVNGQPVPNGHRYAKCDVPAKNITEPTSNEDNE